MESISKKHLEDSTNQNRISQDSIYTGSTTSLLFGRINDRASSQTDTMASKPRSPKADCYQYSDEGYEYDNGDEYDFKLESGAPVLRSINPVDRKFRRFVWTLSTIFVAIWLVGLFIFLGQHKYTDSISNTYESPASTAHTKKETITLNQILDGEWRATTQKISWIEGPNGEDGLLLKEASPGNDYLIVEDIRKDSNDTSNIMATITLMKESHFTVGDLQLTPSYSFPSKDLKKVLIATDSQKHWRHSFHAKYWIFDVETQSAEPLDPEEPNKSIQLASWSPQSNAIVFTRDNNLFLRDLSSASVIQITEDGGEDVFYGVPDWVYEEEVFSGNSATWWAEDGKYIAFLRTNESLVPEFPIQYFLSRPSETNTKHGEESYPDVQNIKYPKAGSPNPIVELQFYDVEMHEVFQVKLADSFAPDDLLITEVVWAGSTGTALIRESNRESDILRVVLIDVISRTGKLARTKNSQELDGGWFEISEFSKYVPADPLLGRPHDGYIDTVVSKNYNHLGYFTPLDNPEPILLTSGEWEVENAPSAIDLKNNLVYFIATKESPIERHVYSVKLDGSDLQPLTNISEEGYYSASFSSGSGFALINYDGPNIPWQRVISTHGSTTKHNELIEDNGLISELANTHDLPTKIYSTINIDGLELQTVEQRPSNFHHKKKYPVLFHVYGGPGSQTVTKKFNVDFQSYVAATLGYVVVTIDGRGTGFIGRKARTQVRGNLGYYEAHDQIEAAKIWSERKYVDPLRLAIWGWSYGGFLTLKTLEQDAGKTFSYGMAVAPVTDWRFYDSIYTERYMHTPEQNPTGYLNSSISNMTAIGNNVRFLVAHGTADDNVHLQNTLTLLDKLDIAGVENYDVQIFPDSDHSIYFHNANTMVYRKLSDWLINAFNGEWLDIMFPVPEHEKNHHHHHKHKHHKGN